MGGPKKERERWKEKEELKKSKIIKVANKFKKYIDRENKYLHSTVFFIS